MAWYDGVLRLILSTQRHLAKWQPSFLYCAQRWARSSSPTTQHSQFSLVLWHLMFTWWYSTVFWNVTQYSLVDRYVSGHSAAYIFRAQETRQKQQISLKCWYLPNTLYVFTSLKTSHYGSVGEHKPQNEKQIKLSAINWKRYDGFKIDWFMSYSVMQFP